MDNSAVALALIVEVMAGNAAAQGRIGLLCAAIPQPCLEVLVTPVVPPLFDLKRCCVTLSGFVASKECFCSIADNDEILKEFNIPKDKLFRHLLFCGDCFKHLRLPWRVAFSVFCSIGDG